MSDKRNFLDKITVLRPVLKLILLFASMVVLSYCTKKEFPRRTEGNDPENSPTDTLQVGIEIGNMAPDLRLADATGNIMNLGDLRGSIVLIDFWAAWCKPCRRENPYLVDAYVKYREVSFESAEGFEIYSISLDQNKDMWQLAITEDSLIWEQHVRIPSLWNSETVSSYEVNAIPATFLLDENGVIIQKDLRGTELQDALENLL